MHSLDLNLCKDGYQIANINCIDLPIAAAARCFNFHYYNYYCFYYCFFANWTDVDFWQWQLKDKILNKLGLSLQAYPIKNRSQLISFIKCHIDQNHPIIMIVKYNSLFYYREYLNRSYTSDHAFIISGYDSDRSLVEIRECVLARHIIQPEIKADILFPLQLTVDLLIDIWTQSNRSFKKEDSKFYNTIYVLQKAEDPMISSYQELVKDILKYDFSFSKFLKRISDFDFKKSNEVTDEIMRRYFYTAMGMFFDGLEKSFEILFNKQEKQRNRYDKFKDEFMKHRDAVTAKMQATILREEAIPSDEKNLVLEKVQAMEEQLFTLIQEFDREQEALIQNYQITGYTFINLADYFNNQGFGKDFPEKTAANFSLKGSFLLPEELPAEKIWQVNDFKFEFPVLGEGINDNIVCDGQIIAVPKGRYSSLLLLGCAEQGNFTESLVVQYDDGACETVTFQFSNFDKQPVFLGERVAWRGPWLKKNTKGIINKTFHAYLVSRKHLLNHGSDLISIKLPVCRNIHLFAISLGKSALDEM